MENFTIMAAINNLGPAEDLTKTNTKNNTAFNYKRIKVIPCKKLDWVKKVPPKDPFYRQLTKIDLCFDYKSDSIINGTDNNRYSFFSFAIFPCIKSAKNPFCKNNIDPYTVFFKVSRRIKSQNLNEYDNPVSIKMRSDHGVSLSSKNKTAVTCFYKKTIIKTDTGLFTNDYKINENITEKEIDWRALERGHHDLLTNFSLFGEKHPEDYYL